MYIHISYTNNNLILYIRIGVVIFILFLYKYFTVHTIIVEIILTYKQNNVIIDQELKQNHLNSTRSLFIMKNKLITKWNYISSF